MRKRTNLLPNDAILLLLVRPRGNKFVRLTPGLFPRIGYNEQQSGYARYGGDMPEASDVRPHGLWFPVLAARSRFCWLRVITWSEELNEVVLAAGNNAA